MVYFITGRKGAGKTTSALKLALELTKAGELVVLLDGDTIRRHRPTGFSDKEREEHIMTAAAYAAILEDQGFVPIISLMSPKREWRQKARKLFRESKLIYIPGGTLWEGTTYEEPDREELE